MDQGNSVDEGAPLVVRTRAMLTPLHAALLMVGAVLGGVALSIILGSSPANAAENPGPDQGPLASVASTVDGAIPGAQHVVHAVTGSVVTAIPATAPLVTPLVTGVDTALTAVDQAIVPVVDGVLPLVPHALASMVDSALAPVNSAPFVTGPPPANAVGSVLTAGGATGADGLLPSPVLTSSTAAPAAALCTLFVTVLALALMGARKRLLDDALPASPVFETDTSPA